MTVSYKQANQVTVLKLTPINKQVKIVQVFDRLNNGYIYRNKNT